MVFSPIGLPRFFYGVENRMWINLISTAIKAGINFVKCHFVAFYALLKFLSVSCFVV